MNVNCVEADLIAWGSSSSLLSKLELQCRKIKILKFPQNPWRLYVKTTEKNSRPVCPDFKVCFMPNSNMASKISILKKRLTKLMSAVERELCIH